MPKERRHARRIGIAVIRFPVTPPRASTFPLRRERRATWASGGL
jgi:hypothetical protein